MDVRAVLIVGVPGDSVDAGVSDINVAASAFAGVPLAFLPVLGRPLIQRIARRFCSSGFDSVSVITNADSTIPSVAEAHSPELRWKEVSQDGIWKAVEDEFNELVQGGAELVVVANAAHYAEIELDSLLQFHLDRRNHVTEVVTADGPLQMAVLSASRRNDAAFALRNALRSFRVKADPFVASGYVTPLRTLADLRMLVVDGLMQKNAIQPEATEVRPGIWISEGARIDRSVRMVAPCFVGAHSRVRAGSLITRASSIEHHCVVDCGTVVESSTVLPLSYLGAGLDLVHSVVGLRRIFSLKHGAEVQVEDASLLNELPSSSAGRTLTHAANLISYIPRQIMQSFLGGRKLRPSRVERECPAVEFDPSMVKAAPAAQDSQKLTATVAGLREYGNQ